MARSTTTAPRTQTPAPQAQAPKGAKLEAFAGLSSSTGAEPIPFGTYDIVTDADGRPELLNGKYNEDGVAVADLYEGEAAEAGGYAGQKRTVFAYASNSNGTEYRLKIGSLFAAIKAAGVEADFTDGDGNLLTEGLELRQDDFKPNGVDRNEYNGRPVLTVKLADLEPATI